MKGPPPDRTLHEGRFLRLVNRGGWEFVERTNASGVVVVICVTPEGKLLLVEQRRPPVGTTVVELPAGLAGDEPGAHGEELAEAARRELLEETGYACDSLEVCCFGPSSAGLTNEVLTVFRAVGARQTGGGGGVAGEDITTHEVLLADVPSWLEARQRAGALVDPKVYAALFFARA